MATGTQDLVVSDKKEVIKAYNLMAGTYDLIDSEAFYINLYECYASHLTAHIDYLKGRKILDIGCGTGIHTHLTSTYAKEVVGIDISEKLLDIAKKKTYRQKNVVFQKVNATDMPFEDETFEGIISYGDAFSHITDYEKAFSEASRVLKKGSIFIFSILNKWTAQAFLSSEELKNALSVSTGHTRVWKCLYNDRDLVALKLKTFSRNEIDQILKENNFRVINTSGINILSSFVPLELQYGKVDGWGKLFIYLGKIDKKINNKYPFNNLGYSKIVTAVKK